MSGYTFREWIDGNKKSIVIYLQGKEFQSTDEIFCNYNGEKDIYQVRKALRELKSEKIVEDKIEGVNTKYWKLIIKKQLSYENKNGN